MTKLVECVPNISEGRDLNVIDTLARVVQGVQHVALLDRHVDPDHHRTVFTMVGVPEAVLKAAYELVCLAAQLIDLSQHSQSGYATEGEYNRTALVYSVQTD